MITQIKNLPENVLGFIFTGIVTGKDYKTVVFPAVKKAKKQKKKIRLVFEFGENFKRLNLKAMMDDTFIGVKYFFGWEKVAMISEHSVINHTIKAFSFLIPGGIKIFRLSERNKAIEWISKK